ncbi:CoA ester lyase [Castellaniella sp.]|uniref:HpcH/HpaI aldolase/citrate lyase family protein n=1 Tax=Castellaniella sp. TaxID=1955812 RepID=UPI002AFF0E4F|nr:CoA ester lyase [Castellaniella sp.]
MMRSLLYVPGSAERFIAKAHLRGADAIIVDLEDAVAASEKLNARAALATVVPRVGQAGAQVFVRVNHLTDLVRQDAEAACMAGAYGLYLPKTSGTEILERLDAVLQPLERRLGRKPMAFVPLIEDAVGVLRAQDIARGPRVLALSMGIEDMATSFGGEPLPDVIRIPRMLIHLAAKAAGKLSLGLMRTVADYRDTEAMRASIIEAKAFGIDGASCIHPSVVPLLNAGFSPGQKEIDHARRLVTAAEVAQRDGIGAFTFEGMFVDAPIVERAKSLLVYAQDVTN